MSEELQFQIHNLRRKPQLLKSAFRKLAVGRRYDDESYY